MRGAPNDSTRPWAHASVPQTFHHFAIMPLAPDAAPTGSDCAHEHPAYAALERALREALQAPATMAEVLAAPRGASIRTRASVMELDGLQIRLTDRTGTVTGMLADASPALREQLSALGLVDATLRNTGDGFAIEKLTLVRRGLVLVRDSHQPRGTRTRADLKEFLSQEKPDCDDLAKRWGRETWDVGSPNTWVWRLDDDTEVWVTAPGRGKILRAVHFSRDGDLEILGSILPS